MADPAILNAIRAAQNLESEGCTDDATIVSDWLMAQPSYRAYHDAYMALCEQEAATAEKYRRTATPEFREAIGVYLDMVNAGHGETDEGQIAFIRAMSMSPDWLLDEFGNMGREMGVIPGKPDGYTDDGEGMYSLDAIGKCLGISEEEAVKAMDRFLDLRARAGLSNDGMVMNGRTIHSVQ
jgi:hypothetical protein